MKHTPKSGIDTKMSFYITTCVSRHFSSVPYHPPPSLHHFWSFKDAHIAAAFAKYPALGALHTKERPDLLPPPTCISWRNHRQDHNTIGVRGRASFSVSNFPLSSLDCSGSSYELLAAQHLGTAPHLLDDSSQDLETGDVWSASEMATILSPFSLQNSSHGLDQAPAGSQALVYTDPPKPSHVDVHGATAQTSLMQVYTQTDIVSHGHPVFQGEDMQQYLYYWPEFRAWRIGSSYESSIASVCSHDGEDTVLPYQAKYWYEWKDDALQYNPGIRVAVGKPSFEQCFQMVDADTLRAARPSAESSATLQWAMPRSMPRANSLANDTPTAPVALAEIAPPPPQPRASPTVDSAATTDHFKAKLQAFNANLQETRVETTDVAMNNNPTPTRNDSFKLKLQEFNAKLSPPPHAAPRVSNDAETAPPDTLHFEAPTPLGMKFTGSPEESYAVVAVIPGGNAERSGIVPGMLMQTVNNNNVSGMEKIDVVDLIKNSATVSMTMILPTAQAINASLGKQANITLLQKAIADHGKDDVSCWEDEDGQKLAHLAAINNAVGSLEALYQIGADLNSEDDEGRTPLARCSYSDGCIEAAEFLISVGADPTIADHYGSTAAETARMHGQDSANIAVLLEQYEAGWTGLVAIDTRLCRPKGLKLLRKAIGQREEDVRTYRDDFGFTLAHAAADCGSVESLKELQKIGVDLNAQSETGCTPLYLVGKSGEHFQVAEYLVGLRVDPTITHEEGGTAYDVAVEFDHSDMAALLLKYLDEWSTGVQVCRALKFPHAL